MRKILKFLASIIPIEVYQKLIVYSILRHSFSSLVLCPAHESREILWKNVFNFNKYLSLPITYIEFGVHKGSSIEFFTKLNINDESVFIGLDSFEGLPEAWNGMQKGFFSTGGVLPVIEDSRVIFIKGLFQNSWGQLHHMLINRKIHNLVVHFDADLYSSTLFALTKIDTLGIPYLAFFDEFTGHEMKALHDYCNSYGAEVDFISKTNFNGFPERVACVIAPIAHPSFRG